MTEVRVEDEAEALSQRMERVRWYRLFDSLHERSLRRGLGGHGWEEVLVGEDTKSHGNVVPGYRVGLIR
jgi:hypothetical protein